MRILVVHNSYQQPGGEDACVSTEIQMLRSYGHSVGQFQISNKTIPDLSNIALFASTIWNIDSYRLLRSKIHLFRPDIVHFHNTFPLISPSGYYAASAEHVPVVQTLHNFRSSCLNALHFRNGSICDTCNSKAFLWPGVMHGCYRGSRAASFASAMSLTLHRLAGTLRNRVNAFIALSENSRRQFIAAGIPQDRIYVKGNSVFPEPQPGAGGGGYAIYVGRLSMEKGISVLLEAWSLLGNAHELHIVGDGPLAPMVQAACERHSTIVWHGAKDYDTVLQFVGNADVLIVPSECYENFPRVIVESFAKGTPVIASDLGAMSELIARNHTGLLFRPGSSQDLVAKLKQFYGNSDEFDFRRKRAREDFQRKHSQDKNYASLLGIYGLAIASHELRGKFRDSTCETIS